MSDSARVQRWRQRMREDGKAPMTLWLSMAEKQRLEDLARQRHCTPAALVQQALASLYATPDTATDTEQIRSVTDTVTDTRHVTDMASATQDVSATVTDTLRQVLPRLVREAIQEIYARNTPPVADTITATRHVSDTVSVPESVSDTVTATMHVPDTVSGTEDVADTGTETIPPFDPAKYRLGRLCVGGHDYHGTGQTLYRLPKMVCPQCDAARARERRAAKRQAAAR